MPTDQAANPLFSSYLIPYALIFLVFYLLVIKPQNAKQKEKDEMRNNIKKSDHVVTAGGIHGTVVMIKEKTVVLRLDDTVRVEFDKEAITTIVKSKKQTES